MSEEVVQVVDFFVNKIEVSLLSALASIMVFVGLINNLYKVQVIDVIQGWKKDFNDKYSDDFNNLKGTHFQKKGCELIEESNEILKRALSLHNSYNIGVAVVWFLIIILWLYIDQALLNKVTLTIIYLTIFIVSIVAYKQGTTLSKERNNLFNKAQELCKASDTTYTETRDKLTKEKSNSAKVKRNSKSNGKAIRM